MSVVEPIQFEAFRISGALRSPGKGALDPVTVLLRDLGGCGQVIVECYGAAWSCFFGAIGRGSLRGFLAGCDEFYLATKLQCITSRRATKSEEAYLLDVCRAAITALKGTA